jgi:hypothetical protein
MQEASMHRNTETVSLCLESENTWAAHLYVNSY